MTQDPPNKLRVMVDANVLFSGCAWPRFPYEVLRHAVLGDYQLLLTPRIIQEARKALAEIAPTAEKRLDNILTATESEEVSTPTDDDIQLHLHLVPRDPKDVHVALAAINGKVDYPLSLDKDLTELNEPIHQYLQVRLPASFLREQMEWTSEALEAIRRRTWDALETSPEQSDDE